MKVLIDADGCPVVDETVKICKEYSLKCCIICDTAHSIERENAQTTIVSKGSDSADFKIVNMLSKGDIAVTQDYALAAMCLARGARAVNQNGMEYTEENIDSLLMRRFISKKIRNAGGRLKGEAKRTKDMTKTFEEKLREMIKEGNKMKIIAATKNNNKLREFGQILKDFEIISQEEAGIDIDVEETGTTFEENSLLKARAIFEKTGIAALADDSGLCVDALDGAPGVYSARYGGEGLDDRGRTQLLLKNMENIPDDKRTARFVSVITLVDSAGTVCARGECEGKITREIMGENGFGYDPVFYVEKFKKTMAQITAEEKNSISHRGKALAAFSENLKKR